LLGSRSFIHGELDIMVSVESTKYIQENLPNKPFDYLYDKDADNSFGITQKSKITFENAVNWIDEHS
jgi:dipeptidyl aminopeptidase/acylaminoacyl peptidase